MAYTDLPFTLDATESDDKQLYCSHREVSPCKLEQYPFAAFEGLCQALRCIAGIDRGNFPWVVT